MYDSDPGLSRPEPNPSLHTPTLPDAARADLQALLVEPNITPEAIAAFMQCEHGEAWDEVMRMYVGANDDHGIPFTNIDRETGETPSWAAGLTESGPTVDYNFPF